MKVPELKYLESMADFLGVELSDLIHGDLYQKISPHTYELVHKLPKDSDLGAIKQFNKIVKNYCKMKRIEEDVSKSKKET